MTGPGHGERDGLDGEVAGPGPEGEDDQGRSGLEHLQAAALEMIAASRALLDAAEQVVADPRAAGTVVDLLESVGALARRREPGSDRDQSDPDDDSPVQHIPLS